MTALAAQVQGIGLIGPGFTSWPAGALVLAGSAPYHRAPTAVPPPAALPPAERRRTGITVRLALAAGLEAVQHAALDPAALPSVFASSGGDGENCHEICLTLASNERQLSPTRFHNSVHNAAAGYWGIATGATPPANVLSAYDGSFAAGLLEALTQVLVERTAVLLIAYDTAYPEPLRAKRPIPDAFAVALVLTPAGRPGSLACLRVRLTDLPACPMADEEIESIRAAIPAARSLPLLNLLARREPGLAVLDYQGTRRLAIEVA
jgi:hypothetical protein